MKKKFFSLAIAGISICFFQLSYLYASEADEDKAFELKPFVSTPSRSVEPMKYATGSVTLISKREIKRKNPETVAELLRDVVGVTVLRQGGIGEEENITIRGVDFDQVLILIDGVKVNSPFLQEFDFGDLLIDNIERIEIARGAYSSVYGSEAIGGVINIITKKGKGKNKILFQQEIGNYGLFRELIGTNGRYDKVGYSLSYSRTDSDGYLPRDTFASNLFSMRMDLKLTTNAHVEYISHYKDSAKDLDSSLYFDTSATPSIHFTHDKNRVLKKVRLRNLLTYKQDIFKQWNVKVYGSLENMRVRDINPADTGVSFIPIEQFIDRDERRVTAGMQHNFELARYDTFIAGFDYEEEKTRYEESYNTVSDFIKRTRSNRAYFIQNRLYWKQTVFLNQGVRIDSNSTYGTFASPRFSGAYYFDVTGTKLKAGYGRGFKSPSFADLYHSSVGNPDLRPEKSQSYEVGFEQKLYKKIINLEAVFFKNLISDLIQSVPFSVRQNIGRAETKGIETTVKIRPVDKLFISTHYTHLKTKNGDTGLELTQKPINTLTASVQYSISRLNVHISVISVGSQFYTIDIIDAEGNILEGRNPGYTVVNIAGTYRVLENSSFINTLEIIGKINNLFDNDYMGVRGLSSPPVNFMLGIRTEF